MNSYLINFAIYTLAMIGFIVMALFVYKKSININTRGKSKEFLQVENSLRLSATKTVYVIKAGTEKFLIAGDPASTTMLAKLNETLNIESIINETQNNEKITEFSTMKKLAHRINRG
ncbi:TPA: flagellar biosynthetic protein FliO [Candidatus Avigastranaerophilus faecigallinarum]|nr:flagellar biosynthetic protein FliO [Candidatus Avigastranaerophilus faecigallinarum]